MTSAALLRPPGAARVTMLSVHTSPLERPGGGDAGGMNVYVRALAARLARAGVQIDVLTRAVSSDAPAVVTAGSPVVNE